MRKAFGDGAQRTELFQENEEFVAALPAYDVFPASFLRQDGAGGGCLLRGKKRPARASSEGDTVGLVAACSDNYCMQLIFVME